MQGRDADGVPGPAQELMGPEQQRRILHELGTIGGIVSALSAGRPVANWASRMQASLDEIAAVIDEDKRVQS